MVEISDFFEVEGLAFEGGAVVFSGDGNPATLQIQAPVGSLYLSNGGEVYKKFGSAEVEWEVLATTVSLEELIVTGPNGPELVFTDDEVIKVEV